MDILDRMETGRLKVARHLREWWDEFDYYYRKDGKIVKQNDDLMDATRYGIMMIRMAAVVRGDGTRRRRKAFVSPEYDLFNY